MSKTARDCASPRAGNGQYLAILPWRSEPALAQEAIPSRLLLVSGVVAGQNERLRHYASFTKHAGRAMRLTRS